MLSSLLLMNRAKMPPVSSSLLSFHCDCFSLLCIVEGEFVIKSHIISKGYLRFDNSAFTIGSDGAVTFRTLWPQCGAAAHLERS